MSTGTLYCPECSRNTADSVSDNLCKIICELGGGLFVRVCHAERLVLWRSPATGATLYCPIDLLSAERVRKTTLESDSMTAITQVEA